MTCDSCVNGRIGTEPDTGEPVFCDCIQGLEVHMNHLAYLMQEQSETMARLSAMRDLPLYLKRTYDAVQVHYNQCKAEYDAVEERYWEKRREPVYDPDLIFFPDYEVGRTT